MSEQIFRVSVILLVVIASIFLFGCTTAQSRRQDRRIEELERRVAKIEFDSGDSPSSDNDLFRYREMARMSQ